MAIAAGKIKKTTLNHQHRIYTAAARLLLLTVALTYMITVNSILQQKHLLYLQMIARIYNNKYNVEYITKRQGNIAIKTAHGAVPKTP